MASLSEDPLLDLQAEYPWGVRSHVSLVVTKSEVIWTRWWISSRRTYWYQCPERNAMSHQDLLANEELQSEITTVFGLDVLNEVKNLCKGPFNYLEILPDHLLLQILGFLELEDVKQLRCCSRRFWELVPVRAQTR
ncbi:F-box only protein 36-like [Periophthalmus magnuspinnatus]|uniref:F-box only protein 36-like n=1 Tax=Periophthalmus magnuspinnatus TaxID=409849 RepID=UPI00145B5C88|nr:F-box only protein 36-like [Periophthalmus magnuspinnatus]